MDPPELQNVGDTPSDMPPDPLLRAGTFIDDDKNNNIGNRETLNENRIVPGDTKVLPDINHQAVEVEVEASPVHPFSDFDDGPPGFVADNSMGPPGFEADNSMRPPGFVDDNSKGPPGFVADNSTGSPGFVADNANCLEVATPVSVTEYTASPAESRSRRGRKRKSEKMGSALIPASVSTERPAWLPPGWTIEYRVRGGGATAGLVDKYYIDPVSGHSFRSKNEVLYYIQNGKKLKKRSTDSPSAEKLTLGSYGGSKSPTSGYLDYEGILAIGTGDFEIRRPKDEWDPISLNYTSGTTSSPKGVVYSHRGAYLNSLAASFLNEMGSMPVYLWTVPMFHCNGWCLPWSVAAQGGTNVCLRSISAKGIFDSIARYKVTHFGGAPTVLNMLINAPINERSPVPGKVAVMTGGAPPPQQVLFKMEELGFVVTHSYGLTETYGPGTVCTWKPEWDSLPPNEQAKIKSRQGLHHLGMEEVDIKDPVTMKSVPPDAKTMGEVMFRGNTVMNGYLKNLKATQEAFNGGWFRSGDLGVKHSDGYIELKDRSKDIIISGGENISTIEVESVLFSHPAILEAAVVGRPDDHWGETPCAFVKLKDGCNANSEEIIKYCRDRLPHYMAPRSIVFEDLPKTSTGKTQKYVLKEKAKVMGSLSKRNPSKL